MISRTHGLSLLFFIAVLLKLRSHSAEREVGQAKAKESQNLGDSTFGQWGKGSREYVCPYHLNLMVLGLGILTSCTSQLYNL